MAWLTAMGIELALVGMTERTLFVEVLWLILALSLLVGRVIDIIRGTVER